MTTITNAVYNRIINTEAELEKTAAYKKIVYIYFKYSIRSLSKHKIHCVKSVCIQSFLSVFSRFRARKVPNMDTFHKFHKVKYGILGFFSDPIFPVQAENPVIYLGNPCILSVYNKQTYQKKVREFAYFTCWQYSDTSILFLFTLVLFETKSCINLYLQKFLTRNFIFKCCEKNF